MNAWDIEIVARTVKAEAGGEGHDGMRAVAHVIKNRFESGKWYAGKTMAGTCGMSFQFSCWNTDDKARVQIFNGPIDDPVLEEARVIVRSLDVDEDLTQESTHYYSTKMPQAPNWVEGATFTVQIGAHRFYKGVS